MVRKFIVSSLFLFLLPAPVHSQEEQLVINLTGPAVNPVFIFENPKGAIKVTGYDGTDILVNASLRNTGTERQKTGTVRKIGQNSPDIYAETEGGNVTLFSRTSGKTVDFDIKIPRNFSLKLKSLDNGTVHVINVNGNIEAENPAGDLILENIAGSAVLSTVYGKISAAFREVNPGAPMMFTSIEGNISLTLPPAVNAVLRMKTGTGEIESDFDIVPEKRRSVVKNLENKKIYSLEDWVIGRINAGGPEYVITTYNGNIFVKKNKAPGNL